MKPKFGRPRSDQQHERVEASMSQQAASELERPRAVLRVVEDPPPSAVDTPRVTGWRKLLRVGTTAVAVLLLPPFLLLAVAPMLLFLLPVAMIGIPFIIPALLCG